MVEEGYTGIHASTQKKKNFQREPAHKNNTNDQHKITSWISRILTEEV